MANLGKGAVVHYAAPVWMAKLVFWPPFMDLKTTMFHAELQDVVNPRVSAEKSWFFRTVFE